MGKLFWLLPVFIFAFVLPVAGLHTCFEQVSGNVSIFGNPLFAISSNGTFYLVSTVNPTTVYHSIDGVSWTGVNVSDGFYASSFGAHVDPAAPQWALLGGLVGNYAITKDGGQSWIVKTQRYNGTAFVTLDVEDQFRAVTSSTRYGLITVDNKDGRAYWVRDPINPFLEVVPNFKQLPVNKQLKFLATWGDYVYVGEPGGDIYEPSATAAPSLPTVAQLPGLSTLMTAGDGALYYGNSTGAVFKKPLGQQPQLIALTGAQVVSIVEYNGNIVISSRTTGANAASSFYIYNGSVAKQFQPPVTPFQLRVRQPEGKLYLIGTLDSGALQYLNWQLFKFKDSCLAENNAPGIAAVNDSFQITANSAFTLNTSASDSDNNTLSFSWTQLSGPNLTNASITAGNFSTSLISFNLTAPGNYTFLLNVTDNGEPPLSTTRNFSITVTASLASATNVSANASSQPCRFHSDCLLGQQCRENQCVPLVEPEARICSQSGECNANESCIAGECIELTCEPGKTMRDHACVSLTVCGGIEQTGQGVCCNSTWIAGRTQCPAPALNASQNDTRPINTSGRPGQLEPPLGSSIAGIPTTLIAIGVIALLLLVLVYFFFLNKKPPGEEAAPESTEESESAPTTEETK